MAKPVAVPNTFAAASGSIPLSQLDDNNTTLVAAINDPATYANYAVDSGAVNAYVITLNPAPSSLASLVGVPITFMPSATNTTSSTINVNGTGVIAIKRQNGAAMQGGDIQIGSIVVVSYDGTQFRLMTVPNNISNSGCRVHNSSSQAITSTATGPAWDTEDWDDNAFHSGSNNYFTVPSTGRYQLIGSLVSGNVSLNAAISLNGAVNPYLAGSSSTTVIGTFNYTTVTWSGLLSAGDIVYLYAKTNAGTNIYSNSFFEIRSI